MSDVRRTSHLVVLLLVLAAITTSFARAAERVVTLSPHLAELVCAAGGCDQLVGVSALSDYPPQVAALPQIGDAFAVNLEVILNLHPDLVLAWDGGTPQATIARLRSLGLRLEAVSAQRLDDIGDALEQVGGWLGTQAAAHSAAQAYRERLASLRMRWRDRAPIRVVYQIETAPAYTINGASPISEAIALCGGVNVFAGLPTLAASVSPEAMLAAQPEVVLFGSEESRDSIQHYWQRLAAAPAQRRGAFYAINPNWLGRATPRILDGVEEVCTKLDDARRQRAKPPGEPAH